MSHKPPRSPRATRARALGPFALLGALSLPLVVAAACGDDGEASAPALDSIADQQVAVGEELVIELSATDEDSDALTYTVSSQSLGITEGGEMTTRPDGTGVFRWRPTAADVGAWFVDFTVSDGALEDTETVVIEVTATAAGVSAPVFRAPLGAGTTLDLARDECIEVDIVVEDPDTPQVAITQRSAEIDQAALEVEDGLNARWTWCPTATQIEESDRYMLALAADDGEHEPTTKNYLIVLRRRPKQDCPGEAPVIEHTPQDHSSPLDITISAEVSDDIGIKREPILYYGLEDPVDDSGVDFAALTPVTMALSSGDAAAGTWTATIPNPVAGAEEGASQAVYYVISAGDNDDEQGDCDHLTDAPAEGAFTISVTNTGGSGGAEPCAPCSADVQCGAEGDLCVHEPQNDAAFCASACGEGGSCPEGYVCVDGVVSVDQQQASQCRPASQSCVGPEPEQCSNDGFEPNDSRSEALDSPMLTEGSTNGLVSCPGDDDWYWFQAGGDVLVEAILDGGESSDLDLGLYDIDGVLLEESASLSSFEAFDRCVSAGGYFLRVSAAQLDNPENGYLLDLAMVEGECGGPTCEDDDAEDDDSAAQAREVALPDPFSSTGNAICSGDDDWYEVVLFSGETLDVALSFTQGAPEEDLDLHFYDSSLEDLTPCSEAEPWLCTSEQGQSGDSNEHYSFDVPGGCTPCTYYVVVRGWDGSENDYDIDITLPD